MELITRLILAARLLAGKSTIAFCDFCLDDPESTIKFNNITPHKCVVIKTYEQK